MSDSTSRTTGAGPPAVAVTGALGHVGSRLLPALARRGHRVAGIVRPGRDARALAALGADVRHADLDRPETLGDALAGYSTLVHLSGLAQVARLIPVLETAGIRRGVFVSSAGVYTQLPSASAEAKRVGEEALRRSRIAYTILRPSMIYGTLDDRNMARLLRWLARCPVVVVPGGGTILQQPVHVDDLVDAILVSLESDRAIGREYDVGGPEALTLRELIQESARAMGRPVWIVPFPIGIAHRAVRLLGRLGLPSPVRPEQVMRLTEPKNVDSEAARRELDFRPRSFREGIRSEAEALAALSKGTRF